MEVKVDFKGMDGRIENHFRNFDRQFEVDGSRKVLEIVDNIN
jgi:hypothetical protein